MKRLLALLAVLAVCISALYFAQHRPRHDAVSTHALVDVAADWQRDVTRVPMHFTRISDAEETQIGAQLAANYALVDPPTTPAQQALEDYVNQVASRVAAHAQRKLPWRFHLLCDPNFINAFALPGGQIFIGTGLLDQLKSEDELAFVLGHEIEHVDHYHAVERVQVEARLHHLDLDALGEVAGLPISLWQTGYSKDEELEADREGLRLAATAGYSAKGAVNLLERWVQLHREVVIHADTPPDELSQLAIEGLMGYFRSHPLPSERLAQANEVIAEDRLPTNAPLRPLLLAYEITR